MVYLFYTAPIRIDLAQYEIFGVKFAISGEDGIIYK